MIIGEVQEGNWATLAQRIAAKARFAE